MVAHPLLGVIGLQQTTLWSALCYFLTNKSRGGDLQSSPHGNTHVKVRLSGAGNVVRSIQAQKVAKCHI